MLSQLIQRQVTIGSKVAFFLKSGREVSGVLTEIGRDHVTVETNGKSSTVLTDMIGAWEIQEEEPQESSEEASEAQRTDGKEDMMVQSIEPAVKNGFKRSSFLKG